MLHHVYALTHKYKLLTDIFQIQNEKKHKLVCMLQSTQVRAPRIDGNHVEKQNRRDVIYS